MLLNVCKYVIRWVKEKEICERARTLRVTARVNREAVSLHEMARH